MLPILLRVRKDPIPFFSKVKTMSENNEQLCAICDGVPAETQTQCPFCEAMRQSRVVRTLQTSLDLQIDEVIE